MKLRNITIFFSIFCIGIFLSIAEQVFSGGKLQQAMENHDQQELNACIAACNSGDCATCTGNGCSSFVSSLGNGYTTCQNIPTCQKACAQQTVAGCTQCTTSPCSEISVINTSTTYQACETQQAQAKAAATLAAQNLASCTAACSNNSNCSECLDPTKCTPALGANAAAVQGSCNACKSACTNSANCPNCINPSNNCGVIAIPAISEGYTTCKTQAQQAQQTAQALANCQGLCGNGSTAGSNCLECVQQCKDISAVAPGYQACNTLLSCQADCTTASGGNCSQCLLGCSNVSAVSSGYQACQAAQATASKLLTTCQTNCTTTSGGNCSQCISQCGSVSAVSSGYQACQTAQATASKLLTTCQTNCTTASGGNCSQCISQCGSVSAVSSGLQACQAQATQAAQLLSSCTSACSTGSGGNCSQCLANCSSLSSNSAVSAGYTLCSAQNSCEAACVSAAGNPTTCQTQCLSNPNCSSLAGVQLSQSAYPGLYACQQAVSNQTNCTSACASNQCVVCLSQECNTPAVTATTGYKNCIATQSCQGSCTGLKGYDQCQSQCFGNTSCQSQGISPVATSSSSQVENASWLQSCLGTVTTYQQCLNVCNTKTLNCALCTAQDCEAILEIKSSAGFQSCNSCATACAEAAAAAGSTNAEWAQCGPCKTACASENITPTTTGAPPALGFCSNTANAWADCNTGCGQTLAGLTSSALPAQVANACTSSTCLGSSACQAAINSASLGAWGGVTIESQYTALTTCQSAISTAGEWTTCNSGCSTNTVQGCTSCLTTGKACAAVGVTPATVGNFELQPAYTNLKACQETLNGLNTCASACSAAPTSLTAASASWGNCGACTETCAAQNITPSSEGAPLALGFCTLANAFSACDAGCASAVQNKSLTQCQGCVNQKPACQMAGIESASTLSSTTTPFAVPAANTNLATCQQWMLSNQSFSQCDSGCANAVTLAECTSCINNSTCQSAGVGITSPSALVAMPASSLQGFTNLPRCQSNFANVATCTAACANAPANSAVPATSTAWSACSACVSACANVEITSSSPGAPAGLLACSSGSSMAACDSGCATANTSQSLSGCNSCIGNNPACSAAGISSTTAFQAMTIPATSSMPLTNLLGCQNLMLDSQLLSACDTACSGQTTASGCSNIFSTNASCTNPRISSSLSTEIASGSYPHIAACNVLLGAVNSCVQACNGAPTTTSVAATDSSWSKCAACVAGCTGVTPTTPGAPAALGVCSVPANIQTACTSGCSGATTSSACTTCVGSPACAAAGITPANISGLTLPSNSSLLTCQSVLEAPADWVACDASCKTAIAATSNAMPTVATCTAGLANTACNSIQVTTTTLPTMTVQANYPNLQGCAKVLNTNNCTTACAQVPAVTAITNPADTTWGDWSNCTNCNKICSAAGMTEFSLGAPVGLSTCTQPNYVAACNAKCAAAATAATGTSIDPTAASQCSTCLGEPVCGLAGITAASLQANTTTANIAAAPNLQTCQATLAASAQCQSNCNAAGTNYNQCQSSCFGTTSSNVCPSVGILASNIITLAENTYPWLNNCATAYNTGNICSTACEAAGTTATPSPAIASACLSNCFGNPACSNIGISTGMTQDQISSYTAINGLNNCQAQVTAQQTACTNYCATGNCAECLSPTCYGFIASTDQNYANCKSGYVKCAELLNQAPLYSEETTISNILSLCTLSNGTATLNSTFTGCTSACALPSTPTYAWAAACVAACADVIKTEPSFLGGMASLLPQENVGTANQTVAPYYQAAVTIVNSCQAANGTLSASNVPTAVNACTACYNGINGIPGMVSSNILNTTDFMPAQCNGLVATSSSCAATCSNATSGNPSLTVSGNSLGITSTQMCEACPSTYNTGVTEAIQCLTALDAINSNSSSITIKNFSSVCSGTSLSSPYQLCISQCQAPGASSASYTWANTCDNSCGPLASVNSALFNATPNLDSGAPVSGTYQAANIIVSSVNVVNSGGATISACTSAYNSIKNNIPGITEQQLISQGNNIMPAGCYQSTASPTSCATACSNAIDNPNGSFNNGGTITNLQMCQNCPNDSNYEFVVNCISSLTSLGGSYSADTCGTALNQCSVYSSTTLFQNCSYYSWFTQCQNYRNIWQTGNGGTSCSSAVSNVINSGATAMVCSTAQQACQGLPHTYYDNTVPGASANCAAIGWALP